MKYNTETFIDKARLVHGDKYDYSRVEYVDSLSKVIIGCFKHGWFEQTPSEHLRGKGCIKCGQIECGAKQKKKASEEFIERCRKIHGEKYSYDKVVYVDSHRPIIVTCKKHGDFVTRPNRMLNGSGCPKCKSDKLHSLFTKGRSEFIRDAIYVHGDMFDYNLVEYENNKKYVKIICRKHGVFEQKPQTHLAGVGCPICGNAGESKIAHYLEEHNINFKKEFFIRNDAFVDRQRRLYADFFIPDKLMVIEYNGLQHYEPIEMWGGKKRLAEQQERDETLRLICESNGYRLIVIPYTHYKNIEEILDVEIYK